MYKTFLILFIFLLNSCSSVPEPVAEKLTGEDLVKLKGLTFFVEEKYLRDGVDLASYELLSFTNGQSEADVVLTLSETPILDRCPSYRMCGNIFSLLVGYFYFYYNIETEFSWNVTVSKADTKPFVVKVKVKNDYPHPGYIPRYEVGLEKRQIYYKDIFDGERARIALEAGRKILLMLSK